MLCHAVGGPDFLQRDHVRTGLLDLLDDEGVALVVAEGDRQLACELGPRHDGRTLHQVGVEAQQAQAARGPQHSLLRVLVGLANTQREQAGVFHHRHEFSARRHGAGAPDEVGAVVRLLAVDAEIAVCLHRGEIVALRQRSAQRGPDATPLSFGAGALVKAEIAITLLREETAAVRRREVFASAKLLASQQEVGHGVFSLAILEA